MSEASDPRIPLLKKDLPATAKPMWRLYLELSRLHVWPGGTNLFFLPCVWGYLLAARNDPPPADTLIRHFVLLLGFSTLIGSATCVINDICDRDLDRLVERCKTRPIASGAVSVFGATVFLLVQVGLCVWIITMLNPTAMICGLFGLFVFHGFYPLMKRLTNWPQAYLGLAMNWGLPTTWLIIAPQDVSSPVVWVLTFGALCWTMVYDTIYACQDREDDIKAGVKSTAVLFGSWIRPILAVFGIMFIATLVYTGVETNMTLPYYVIGVAGTALHTLWQVATFDPSDGLDCAMKFVGNGNLALIYTVGLITAIYMPDLLKL